MTPIVKNPSILDLFKNLLGEAEVDQITDDAEQRQVEPEREEEQEVKMGIKLEREAIRIIMQEAMQAGEQRAFAANPLAAERSGGDID